MSQDSNESPKLPIILPSCGRCYWIVKGFKDARENLPFLSFCSHPKHTARAQAPCKDKRELRENEIPLSTRK